MFSEDGGLRFIFTDAPGRSFRSLQYCRRARACIEEGIQTVSSAVPRFSLGVETQLQIAADLEFLSADQTKPMFGKTEEILRMLNGLMASLVRPPG
jgi:hypothetical protein